MLPFIEKKDLRLALEHPLPAWEGQKTMSVIQDQHLRLKGGSHPKMAGVLLIFEEKNQTILLIERASHPRDKHKGQISFPGGKVEREDANLWHTALRETHEEIGLLLSEKDILGALSPLYIPVSNYKVHPFLSFVNELPTLNPSQDEVEKILYLPVHDMGRGHIQRKDIRTPSGIVLKSVPYFSLDDRIIWGATAMILSEFYLILQLYFAKQI